MNCPKCGNEIGRNRRYCEYCGADTVIAIRLNRRSNRYYNEGLAKAQVRDLSGAVMVLKKSLECNKRNIEARNLLGLVYFEMGETVAALSEWIISKHFMPQDNDADYFISKVQSNPAKLDSMNQTIKKYNQALAYAKQGSDDLAMLQLRKVISTRPGYVRALQLLALLYMKNGEYEKAKRCLIRAQKTDVANTTTLSYLAEIERVLNPEGGPVRQEKKPEATSYQVAPSNVPFQEDKPNYIAFITFFAGILIGIAVLYWLIVPTVRDDIKAKYTSEERDYGAEIAGYTANISVLESEKQDLTDRLKKAEEKIAELEWESEQVEVFDADAYEKLWFTILEYPAIEEEVKAAEKDKKPEKVLEKLMEYAKELQEYSVMAATRKDTDVYYKEIKAKVDEKVFEYGYDYGHDLYNAAKYTEAVKYLQPLFDLGDDSADTLYFLARSYQRSGDSATARTYFQLLVDQYPGSERANMAHQVMDGLN